MRKCISNSKIWNTKLYSFGVWNDEKKRGVSIKSIKKREKISFHMFYEGVEEEIIEVQEIVPNQF